MKLETDQETENKKVGNGRNWGLTTKLLRPAYFCRIQELPILSTFFRLSSL